MNEWTGSRFIVNVLKDVTGSVQLQLIISIPEQGFSEMGMLSHNSY